jgi:hypothetical protein
MTPVSYLPPRLLQVVGLILLIAFTGFWAVTGRESVLLVGAAGSLILLGNYGRAIRSIVELAQPSVQEQAQVEAEKKYRHDHEPEDH